MLCKGNYKEGVTTFSIKSLKEITTKNTSTIGILNTIKSTSNSTTLEEETDLEDLSNLSNSSKKETIVVNSNSLEL